MKRLIAALALLTFGGCSCFDEAYEAFCSDTGKCDGGRGGDGGAAAVTMALDAPSPIAVSRCKPGGRVSFRDAMSIDTPVGGSGCMLRFSAPTGVTIRVPDCGGLSAGSYVVAPGEDHVNFAIEWPHFATWDLTASCGVLGPATTSFTATAQLQFEKPAYRVINGQGVCGAADELILRAYSTDLGGVVTSPGTASDVRVSAPDTTLKVGRGTAMCVDVANDGGTVYPLPELGVLRLYAESTGGPGTHVTVTAAAVSAQSGLTGVATTDVYTTCFPVGLGCSGDIDCCQLNYCDAGVCTVQ